MTEILTLKRKAPAPGTYTMKIVNGKVTRVLVSDKPATPAANLATKTIVTTSTPPAELSNSQRNNQCKSWLETIYPGLFVKENIGPLKIGIYDNLVAVLPENISKKTLNKIIAWHVKKTSYLEAMVIGAERHDLQGNVTGVINKSEAGYAAMQLRKRAKAGSH